jgi:hypothetical protein
MLKPDVNPYFSNFAIPFIGYLSKAIYNSKKTSDWSLITHLYYPPGYCATDFLDETLTTVQYSKCNNIISIIQALGEHAKIGKIDINSAFFNK